MSKAILYDATLCINCKQCESACAEQNKLPYNEVIGAEQKQSAHKFTVVQERSDKFMRRLCMNCLDPTCASVCPVGAFTKTAAGPVVYDENKCMGCRYCMVACPFNIPKYEWESTSPWIRKCTFCADRLADGKVPACIKVCPTNVMFFGPLDEVKKEAEKRLKENPGKYVNHIYGKEEAGGTSWMYLSAVPFNEIGFDTKIPAVKLPDITWGMLSEIPVKVAALVVGLGLIAAFRNRGAGGDESSESKSGKEK